MKKEFQTGTEAQQRTAADSSTSASVEANPMLSDAGAELLKPRFEVIADFPKCSFKIGRIITPIKNGSNYYDCIDAPSSEIIGFPEKYPHLFRKMNWWEKREAEEMPNKVMSLADDKRDIFEIEEWDMDILVGWIDKQARTCCSLLTFKPEYGYVPV